MNKIILLFVILFVNLATNYGQNTIKGNIIDQQKETIPFANVVLYQNKKPLTGVVSDASGNYLFNDVTDGNYWLEVSVLGYKIARTKAFELSRKKQHQTFNFTIEEEAQSLDEVVIKTKRPTIKQTAEKMIVDLEKSDMVSSNLQDVMKRIPGIIVTNNGLSYAGQNNIRILINGKTTDYMDIDSLLRDFPADNISRIELIEQPGAEFDAEGSGPIINIILKKNVKLGTNGNVKAWVGEDQGVEFGTSAAISSYKNKLNWQVSTGYSQPTWREDLFVDRTTGDGTTYKQATKSPYAPKNLRANAGIHYYFNHKNTAGLTLSHQTSNSDRISTDHSQIITNTFTNYLNTANSYNRDRVVFNVNPYYEFDNDKDKLTLDFNYVNYDNNNTNNLYKTDGNTVAYNNQRFKQIGKYQIKTYKVDYKHIISNDFNLLFGSKFAQVNTDNDLKTYTQNNTGVFNFIANESNQFLIDESIFGIYTKVNATVKKWSFSGGLRYEDSKTIGLSNNTNETKTRNISKLFPSASISRKITDTFGAGISYSYRIKRPSYSSLNSFVYHYNPIVSERGNPNLKPSFTNSYKFNLTYNSQPFFTIGYRKTQDALMELVSQDDFTGNVSRAMDNIDTKENWNFRIFAPLSFAKGLDGYSGFIVDYNKLHKNYATTSNLDLKKWSLMWYTSVTYKLPWNIKSELSGFYSTGPLEGQLDMEWLASLEFAMSKKFLNKKLKVNLGMRKILNRQFHGNLKFNNLDATVESAESKQNIYLQLAYNFGSSFGKKKEKKNEAQDEENRIRDNN